MYGRAILTAALLLISVRVLGQWLQPGWIADVRAGCKVLPRPDGDDLLRVWPLSQAVNSRRHDGVKLLERHPIS
jgi:hypothetical protein